MKKIPFSYSTYPNIYRRARRKTEKNNSSISKEVHAFLESYVEDEPELPDDCAPIVYESLKPKAERRKPDTGVNFTPTVPLETDAGNSDDHEDGTPHVDQALGEIVNSAEAEFTQPKEDVPSTITSENLTEENEEVLGPIESSPLALKEKNGKQKAKVPTTKDPFDVAPKQSKGGSNSKKNVKAKKALNSQSRSTRVKPGKTGNLKRRSK